MNLDPWGAEERQIIGGELQLACVVEPITVAVDERGSIR